MTEPFDGPAFFERVIDKLRQCLLDGKDSSGDLCADIVSCLNLPLLNSDVVTVEAETRGQTSNLAWHEHRKHVICSSEAVSFLASNTDTIRLAALFTKLMVRAKLGTVLSSHATNMERWPLWLRRGALNEEVVYQTVECCLPELVSHMAIPPSWSLHRPGFMKLAPHIGASPDALIKTTDDVISAILEIKCPRACYIDDTDGDVGAILHETLLASICNKGWAKLGLKTAPLVDLTSSIDTDQMVKSELLGEYGRRATSQNPFLVTLKRSGRDDDDVQIDGVDEIHAMKAGSLVVTPYHRYGVQMCLQGEAVARLQPDKPVAKSYMIIPLMAESKEKDIGRKMCFKGDATSVTVITKDVCLPLALLFVPFIPSQTYVTDVMTGLETTLCLGATYATVDTLFDRGDFWQDGVPLTTDTLLTMLERHYHHFPNPYVQPGRLKRQYVMDDADHQFKKKKKKKTLKR